MGIFGIPSFVVTQFAGLVENYIVNNRKKYTRNAVALTTEQRAAMLPFFPAEILDQTRLRRLKETRVEDPTFYGMARMFGVSNLPTYSDKPAVTFDNVIIFHEDITNALLFHELVHVVEYAQLGTKEFASRYVNGFLDGGSYEKIPLERYASHLEKRYSKNEEPFSVDEAVKKAIATRRL